MKSAEVNKVDALVQVIETSAQSLFASALKAVKNHHTAEEIVQATYEKAFKRLDQFRGEIGLRSWMHIILESVIRDRMQYERVRQAHHLVDPDVLYRVAPASDELSIDPERSLLAKESTSRVKSLLSQLSPEERWVIGLNKILDVPLETISEVTTMPMNTIKSHSFRGKKVLRDHLHRDDD